jgi:adenylosuccinate synthase
VVAARYATRLSGFDTLALTKLDVLDELAEIPVCTAYRFEGETFTEFPSDLSVLEGCEPVLEKLPGWTSPTPGVRQWDALPAAARDYVERLSELVGTEVGIVSTGPDRDDTVIRERSALASWFS